ncbi:MAG TPA: PAS domain S-box protein, partial [Thermoanaerobaculia bacterium]|nr:PAS domain S-box protein [Thermoanaerobaculia bacterium]
MTVPSYQPSSGPAPSGRFERSKASLIRLMRGQRASQRSQRTTIAILRAQQEATLDGILVVDQRGRILSYNQRFLEIWGIPVTLAATGVDEVILHYAADAVIDKAGFLALVEFLYAHPEEIRNGDLLALKDGRVLSRSSVPVVVDNGKITGRAWYFRDITEARKAEILQSALFRIAQLSRDSKDLDEFYAAVHQIVGELMDARNFYIAEWNSERDILTFPYFVDECDKAPEGLNPGRGLSAYVLRTGQPLLARPKDFEELEARGEVESVGAPSVDWLGVPLRTGERTWGVLGVQTYDESIRYTDRDKEILVFVSQHVASAIEHKRKEDAIRESEKRYRQMFENNRAVQLLIDPATGAIVDANMSAADFYGYTIADLRTKQIWDINVLGPEKLRGELKRASQTEAYFVFQHRRANGEIRDVEVHSGPIDVQGRQLLYSIIHDITERRRAEQALQQSEEKYRNIFDYASTGIYQSTLDGQLITVNNALAQMLGYDSPEDLLQRNLTYDIYYHTTDRQALIHDFVSGGTGADHEVPWRRKDGSLIWVQLNAHANRTPQGSVYFEGFVYDITERKHA